MKKRVLLCMTVCLLLLTVFAGCAGKNADPGDDTGSAKESAGGGHVYGGDILVEYQSCGGGLQAYEESCFSTVYSVMTDQTIRCYLECSAPEIAPAVVDVFTIDMTGDTYEELYKLVDKKDVLSLDPKEDTDACDGYSYYLRMYDKKDQLVGQVGGYMPTNKNMVKITGLILKDIPQDKMDEIGEIKNSLLGQYRTASGNGGDDGGGTVDREQEIREIYYDFMCGNRTVSTSDFFTDDSGSYYWAILPGEYTYPQLKAAYESYDGHDTTTSYAFADLGNDGTEELILRFDNTDSSFMNWVGIIRCEKEGLELVYAYEDGYRTWSQLYETGYLNIGGSFGAGAHGTDLLKINGRGEAELLYTVNYFYGSFATQIGYDLSQDGSGMDELWEYAGALGDWDSELEITEYVPAKRDGAGVKIWVEAYSQDTAAREVEDQFVDALAAMGAELVSADEMERLLVIPDLEDSTEVEWTFWEERCTIVKPLYFEYVYPEPDSYREVSLDTGEDTVRVMIASNKKITEVKVLALEAKETAAGGGLSFDAQECFSCGEIAPDMPLVLGISFRGTLPDYAISYLDENGKQEIKSINLSGYDARLVLEDVTEEYLIGRAK